MSIEILGALALFALVSSITPGPNNLMLMNSGASFGIKKTIPHVLGVVIGFDIMVMLVGTGIMGVFERYPIGAEILKIASIAYLLYLSYQIATSTSAPEQADAQAKPMSFLQAALFQWINPKAWTMALTAISVYATSTDFKAVLFVTVVFGLINLPSVSVWVFLGKKMQSILTSQTRLRAFNMTMALLLVGSLYPVILPMN